MIRFLHTSDWQLGMTRHFLSEGAQERYGQARFDAIRTMGRVAGDQHCQFMLVCGDAFESNLAKAAKECQIVIFTCVPERYGNVGEATVVAIG